WPGAGASLRYGPNADSRSFKVPLYAEFTDIPDSVYYYGPAAVTVSNISFPGRSFIPQYYDPSNYLDVGIQPFPKFGLLITNRLQTVILDGTNIVDYVQLGGLDQFVDIYSKMADGDDGFWSTNFTGGPHGVINQIDFAKGNVGPPLEDGDSVKWSTQPVPGFGTTQADEENYFYAFFKDTSRKSFKDKNGVIHTVTNLLGKMQAPVSISRNIIAYTSWQANDPLVHYLNGDLNFSGTVSGYTSGGSQRGNPASLTNQLGLGTINARYAPWGQFGVVFAGSDANSNNIAY